MPSKGGENHKRLKEKALEQITQNYDIDKINHIHIEPAKNKGLFREAYRIQLDLFGLRAERSFFPDLVFMYPLEEPVKIPEEKLRDLPHDWIDSSERTIQYKVVTIECEVGANSELLKGGLRTIGYQLLKEQFGDLLHLVLAKYSDVKMKNTNFFDEVWEFDRQRD